MDDRRLLRIEDAAQRLSVGRSTIYAMVAAGQIPSLKLARSLRIPADALDRWLAEETKRQAEDRVHMSTLPATAEGTAGRQRTSETRGRRGTRARRLGTLTTGQSGSVAEAEAEEG